MISLKLQRMYKRFMINVVKKSNTGWDEWYMIKTKEGKFLLLEYFRTFDSDGYRIRQTYQNELETIENLRKFIRLGYVDYWVCDRRD